MLTDPPAPSTCADVTSLAGWADGRGLSGPACNAVAGLVLSEHTAGELLDFCEVVCEVGAECVPELLAAGVLTIVRNPRWPTEPTPCSLLRIEPAPEGR
jgi:hypothetical protein